MVGLTLRNISSSQMAHSVVSNNPTTLDIFIQDFQSHKTWVMHIANWKIFFYQKASNKLENSRGTRPTVKSIIKNQKITKLHSHTWQVKHRPHKMLTFKLVTTHNTFIVTISEITNTHKMLNYKQVTPQNTHINTFSRISTIELP